MIASFYSISFILTIFECTYSLLIALLIGKKLVIEVA